MKHWDVYKRQLTGPICTQPLPPLIVGNILAGPTAIIKKIMILLRKTKNLNEGFEIIL